MDDRMRSGNHKVSLTNRDRWKSWQPYIFQQ